MVVAMKGTVMTGVLLALGWVSPAFAAGAEFTTEPAYVDEPAPVPERWYGWQTLTPDAAAFSMAAITTATEEDALLWGLGIGTYTLGAPLVHVSHGRPLVGLGDFALRLTVPAAGMFVGSQLRGDAQLCPGNGENCSPSDAPIKAGGLIAAALVSALDAALFSYEPLKPERRPAVIKAELWPNVTLTPNGGHCSLSGTF